MLWFTPLCATRSKSERTKSQPKSPSSPLQGARGDLHPDKGRIHPSGCPLVGFVWCCICNDKIAIMFVFDVRSGSTEGRRRMGERGGAMTVISLQKQPGTVERDGSRRASPPILAAASLPTGHSGCRAVACDRDERLRPVLAARRGQPRSRRGGHVWPGPGGYFNSEARFRCRCSEAQSPLQFVIAAGQRARGIADAPTSAYAAVVLNWTLAGRTPAMRVLSRLDVRPTKKYTSALS